MLTVFNSPDGGLKKNVLNGVYCLAISLTSFIYYPQS